MSANDYLAQRCAALEKQNQFLKTRLEQRYEETVNEYKDRRRFFDKEQEYVLNLFLDLPPNVGLTRTEIPEEFAKRYPELRSVDSLRRAYELCAMNKLWRHKDDDGLVRFYLKLNEPNDTQQVPTRDHEAHAKVQGACQVLNGDYHQ